jgi:hypothetical protein
MPFSIIIAYLFNLRQNRLRCCGGKIPVLSLDCPDCTGIDLRGNRGICARQEVLAGVNVGESDCLILNEKEYSDAACLNSGDF